MTTIEVSIQHCPKCDRDKHPEEFARSKAKTSGRNVICKECSRAYSKWHRSQPKGRAKSMWETSRKRATEKGWEFTLTPEWIEERLIAGRCQATGIPLELVAAEGDTIHFRPWTPSLDRTDGTGGYTPDNVQVVCWMYNQAKGVSNHAAVVRMAEHLINV